MDKEKRKLKKNSTERALLASALSIVLCCTMLFGTTYAWFSQTITANVAVIQTGTLTVEIVDADGEAFTSVIDDNGSVLEFLEVDENGNLITPAEGKKTTFEPGKTYQLPGIRVKNSGDIDLQYEIMVEGITKSTTSTLTEDTEGAATLDLRDVLIFTTTVGDATAVTAVAEDGSEESNTATDDDSAQTDRITGILLATDVQETAEVDERFSDIITISATLNTEAEDLNAYQGLQLSDIKLIVYATQLLERETEAAKTESTEGDLTGTEPGQTSE